MTMGMANERRFNPGSVLLFLSLLATHSPAAEVPGRIGFWVDALRAEPVEFDEMVHDLKSARVIYLGEYHTIPLHHRLEVELLRGLNSGPQRFVVAMEQFEFMAQPALDRFNAGSIDAAGLVNETALAKRWPGYTNYIPLLDAARELRIPALALNGRAETIRAIGRGGLAGLNPEQKQELPGTMVTDDPLYERFLNQTLAVHMAFDPKKLRPVYEAQVARDETMAERLHQFLSSPAGKDRAALVICGQGHCEFGLGIPARVERRVPGIRQRIVLFSESGDLELSPEERKQARNIEITHQFLKDLGRPPADYLHVFQAAAP